MCYVKDQINHIVQAVAIDYTKAKHRSDDSFRNDEKYKWNQKKVSKNCDEFD